MVKCFSKFYKALFCLSLLLTGFTAARGVAPVIHIAPKPAWLNSIQPYNKPTSLRTVEGGYFFQLVEHQVQVEKQAYYHHLIRQIVTDAGIQNGSEISVSFDPAFGTLTFHSITVWRHNKPQQRLNAGAFKVVADEKELSDFIYQAPTQRCVLLKVAAII